MSMGHHPYHHHHQFKSINRARLVLTLFACLTVLENFALGWHHPTSDFYPSSRRLYYKNPRNAPSEFCPRDETQAQLQGRTCLRKCTSDEDCKSKKKKCLCDGACGLSCIKPEKECGDPEPPLDVGDVRITGKTFGSKAIYSCPPNFRVIGMEERICQADGTWSSSPPSCKKSVFCMEPPRIPNARHNAPVDQTTFDLDTSLQYQCHPGYTTSGFARSKCFFYNGTAKWFGPDFNCEPISCGTPPDILNGRREGYCHHYQCKVTYVCQPGFEIVGKAQHACHQNGSWIPEELPTCAPVQCDPPSNPANGKAVYSTTSFNSVVTYECKYGFMLVGEGTRRCGPHRRWTGNEPQCKEINCGSPGNGILYNGWIEGSRTTLHAVVIFHCLQGMTFEGPVDRVVCQSDGTWSGPMPHCQEIQCPHPGHLNNGWIENIERGAALGNSIIFRCFDGMTLVGHGSAICNIDGRWTHPLPFCMAPCAVTEVPFGTVTKQNAAKSNGSLAEISGTNFTTPPPSPPIILQPGALVPHGQTIGLECEKQYEPTYNFTPSMCNNGTWTHPPRCQPARCKQLPKGPRHGMLIAPKMDHGMKARYTCRDGFVLVGNNVTECQYGVWRGETPTCQITYCKYLPPPEHGRVLLVGNMGLYDYRNYVTKVANNRQIMFECDRGYVLADGPQGKTCIRGEWAPKTDPPRCLPSQHPSFRWIRSVRKKRRAIKSGSSIGIRNKPGGGGGGGGAGPRRTIKKNKKGGDEEEYELAPPFCDPLQSEYIQTEEIVAGEDENATSFSSGAVLKVSCIHGFGVNLPNETVRCVLGKWKPKAPQCNALPCKTPYIIHGTLYDGSKAMFFLEAVKHTKTIEVKCSKGYILKGKSQVTCWYGEWSVDDIPECVPATCVLPSIEYGHYIGGYRNGVVVTHGTEVDYACGGDFKKMVQGPSRCHLGAFKPNKPVCLHPSVALNYSTDHGDPDHSVFDHKDSKRKGSSSRGPGSSFFSMSKRGCGSPPREKGAIAYTEGKPIEVDSDFSFPDGTEILYRCGNIKPKTKNRWKISCEDGSWVGTALPCDEDLTNPQSSIQAVMKMINGSCTYHKDEEFVATFFNDQHLTKDTIDFPSTSILVSRCADIGKYQMTGNIRRKCVSGLWLGMSPKCIGNSQLNDYALDKPPTILFRYVNGSIIQSNDGKLVVYTGTTLHMECLWIRKFGTPKWEISNPHKDREEKAEAANKESNNEQPVDVLKRLYNEGWAPEDEGRNSALEYRLTIDDAQEEDSGSYTCVTPARHRHKIFIIVKSVDCRPLPEHADLIYSTTETKLGTNVTFKCRSGNALVGAHSIVCLASGNWSATIPRCENVECADISLLPAMAPLAYTTATKNGTLKKNETAPPKITVISRDVGGRALFSCSQGYTIQGSSEAVCQSNGEWSSAIPLCREVECREPPPPDNGFVSGNPPYKAGDLAQFDCNQGYMMEGQPIVACQDNGKWSRASTVKCVQACTYPGTTIGGTISQVKFYYGISETVTFDCTDGYELQGARMLHCMKNGKWSNSIPVCKSLGDKNNNSNSEGKSGKKS